MSKKIAVFVDYDPKPYEKLILQSSRGDGSLLGTQAGIPQVATRFFNYTKRDYTSKGKTDIGLLVFNIFAENPKIVVVDPFRLKAKDARDLVSSALEKNCDRALIWTNKANMGENDNSSEISASLNLLKVQVYDKQDLASFLSVLKEKYANGCKGCKTCNCTYD